MISFQMPNAKGNALSLAPFAMKYLNMSTIELRHKGSNITNFSPSNIVSSIIPSGFKFCRHSK